MIQYTSSVTKIRISAFENCTSLCKITFSNKLNEIEEFAFFQCANLTEVTLPDSVIDIGDFAFSCCPKMNKLKLSNSLIYIGNYAFDNCKSITEVTIPSSVSFIGDYAFGQCTSLKQPSIPTSVSFIGENAFAKEFSETKEEVAEDAAISKPVLNTNELTLKVGERYRLKLKNAKKVTWKSENKKSVKISSKGTVRAVTPGTTRVYAVYKKKKYYCTIHVPSIKTYEGRYLLAKEEVKKIIQSEGIDKLELDVNKVRAVHDYIILNADYSDEKYYSSEAYGLLFNKAGICGAYQETFQLFMDVLNIPCVSVDGIIVDEGGHGWNIVTIEGENYHIDVTWDDPVSRSSAKYLDYEYFLVDDAIMVEKDHIWDFETSIKANGKKYKLYQEYYGTYHIY